jgi:hypothetical protein
MTETPPPPAPASKKPRYAICNCPSVPVPHLRLIRPPGGGLLSPGPREGWGIVIDNRNVKQ